jgi:hypothetical protein
MKMHVYDIEREPKGTSLQSLLSFVFELAVRFTLHARRFSSPPDDSFVAVQRELEPWLLSTVPSWGRDEVARGELGYLYSYGANGATAEILKRATDRLYKWRWPWLPEEPSFYRADGKLLLATLPQDRLAWLELSSDEVEDLQRRIPDLLLSRRAEKIVG